MKKTTVILLILLSISGGATAKKEKTLSKVMTLKIERTGGSNGASVAWNPDLQLYYAAMAGNTYYPMVVYHADGKAVSDNKLETMFDVRGLWFNTSTKMLQANGYSDFGMAEYKTDDKGIPESVKKLPMASKQPNEQSTGAYDPTHSIIYFYDNDSADVIKEDFSGNTTKIRLHLGIKKKKQAKKHSNSEVIKHYNENTCVYSGVANAEIGLLNFKEREIELYNPETGLLKKVIKLPADAPLEQSLNFSNCNGIYWLFDKKKREWRGYQ